MRTRKPSLSVIDGGKPADDAATAVVTTSPQDETRVSPPPAAERTALSVLDGGKVVHRESDLDAAVERVGALKAECILSGWALGRAIAVIYDQQLWRLRTAEGKPQVFRTFESFCNAELHISPQYALQLIEVGKRYSEQQALSVKASALRVLMRVPPGARHDELFQQALEGASVRQLEARVNEVQPRTPRPPAKRVQAAMATAAPPAPTRSDRITVAAELTKPFTVKLWKKQTGRLQVQLADTKPLTRAKTIGHEPVGRIELRNGVSLYVQVQPNAAGELEMRCRYERDEVGP